MEPYMPPSEKLRPEQLMHIADLIQRQLGLIYNGNKLNDLERRLNHVLQDVPPQQREQTVAQLLAGQFEQIPNLIPELTIPETYFLRNIRLFKALKSSILPQIIERKKYARQINIWSAGCSSGEEPYSVAILLHELLNETISQWKINLIATDLNEKILQKARRAAYSEWSFRGVPPDFKARHFTPLNDGSLQLKPEIRQIVTFLQHNLIEGAYPPVPALRSFDIILCRNVLIYMSHATVQTILEKFYAILNDQGYLITGPSEFPTLKNKKFQPVMVEGTIVYQKTAWRKVPAKKPHKKRRVVAMNTADKIRKKLATSFKSKSTAFSIAQNKFPTEITKKDEKRNKETISAADNLDRIRKLANQGRLNEALELGKEYVKRHISDKLGHYLTGTILLEKGDLKEAETSLQRAIYLDPDFVMAHFTLANVYAMTGRKQEALKRYRNILKILKAMVPSETVAESEGMVVSQFKDLVSKLVQSI